MTDGYSSGACNIGPAETARRRRIGWLGVAGVAVLCIGLRTVEAAPVWRLTVFFPASIAASGFIQAHMRFCAAFGYMGSYNFDELGNAQRVALEAYIAKDRRKARSIVLMSAGIGALAALVAVAAATAL